MEIAYVEEESDPELHGTFESRDFTVIIPAYNEESRITPVLEDICHFVAEHSVSWKIIVMIDGSDGTLEVVKKFSKKYPFLQYTRTMGRNGKGGAIRRSLDLIDSDFVILMDADNSVAFEKVLENVHLLKYHDVVILSRYVDGISNIPFLRRIISRGFNLALRVFLDLRISDTQSGYKLLRTTVFREAMSKVTTTNTFYDVAMLYYVKECGSKILEIPVPYEHCEGSTFRPMGEIIGQGVSLLAFTIRHTRLFNFIPKSLTDLYYRKFRWM